MFDEQWTRRVLAEVCRTIGRPATNAKLLRHHTNAVYAVEDVVIKIAPQAIGVDVLRNVVALVEWLTASAFPTVQLATGFHQPLEVHGHGVTVWRRLDDTPISVTELGELLRALHLIDHMPPVPLASLDPLRSIRRSLAKATILDDEDRTFLTKRLEVLARAWESMDLPLGWGLIQSDPQVRNALRTPNGAAVLADWDGACFGPRIWDVATAAVHCRRFGIATDFRDFEAAYGWTPRSWDQFEDLCQLRELQMIATNARKSAPDSPAAGEVYRRIAGLREGATELTAWSIL